MLNGNNFKLNSDEKGMSFVEVLIGSAILGIAIWGFLQMSNLNQSDLNTFKESIQIMKIRNTVHRNLSKENLCMDLLNGTTWSELTASPTEFSQAQELESAELEAIFPSKFRDYFLNKFTIKQIPAFNVSALSADKTYDVRADVFISIHRKERTNNKESFRYKEVQVAAEENPVSLFMSIGNDGEVKSCYLRSSKQVAMASYMCSELGGILKTGKCMFPIYEGNPANANSFLGVNSSIHNPSVKLVTLQQFICKLEKSVVAIEAKGVDGIINPDTGFEFDLAKGKDPIFAVTKFCSTPQGSGKNGANPPPFFLDDI